MTDNSWEEEIKKILNDLHVTPQGYITLLPSRGEGSWKKDWGLIQIPITTSKEIVIRNCRWINDNHLNAVVEQISTLLAKAVKEERERIKFQIKEMKMVKGGTHKEIKNEDLEFWKETLLEAIDNWTELEKLREGKE